MDKPRPIDSNCLTTAARKVGLSRALPLPPATPLCQMLSCSSRRRTTAMASIPFPLLLPRKKVCIFELIFGATYGCTTIDKRISQKWSDEMNVSGEWDGHGADFTREGCPIKLLENVVPVAYREWEVKVFDWQTQCPTLANPDEHILLYKNIELLPAVGCEANAATR
ncbi:hypothetical protein ACFX1X_024844 [Malus domestica]